MLKPFTFKEEECKAHNAMPPQITNLRLLFANPNPNSSPLRFSSSLFLLFKSPNKSFQNLKPISILSCSFKKHRSYTKPFTPTRRNNTSLTDKILKEEGSVMEETDSFAYNKKRAAGKDKNDRPKNLQLKVRKLNPINTICYVQVMCIFVYKNKKFLCFDSLFS